MCKFRYLILLFAVLISAPSISRLFIIANFDDSITFSKELFILSCGTFNDLSAISFLMLPILLLPFFIKQNNTAFKIIASIFQGIIFFVYLVFIKADYIFYTLFRKHIGVEIFSAQENAEFLVNYSLSSQFVFLLISLLISCCISVLYFNSIKQTQYVTSNRKIIYGFWLFISLICITFESYFFKPHSHYPPAHSLYQVCLNPIFNLANAFRTNHEIRKEKFISDNAAENVLWYLYSKNEEWHKSSNIFLRKRKFPSYGNRNKKPNFIIFFLESFNSEYISSNSSKAKELNRLKREGTYFPSFFSAGTRSRIGLNALLYSVPPIAGIPSSGIINGKNIFYPFAEYFNSMGYSTLYMQSASFSDGMVSAKASRFNYTYSWRELFGGDKEKRNDADGMSLFMKKLKSLPTTRPFLGIYYTALPHHSYNQTIPNKSDSYKNTDEKNRYEYQASYIDENIEEFMKQAEQQDWFKDTVFVFLPDHRGQLSEDFNRDTHTNRDDFLSFAIFYAPEIIKQGYVDKSISGQEDILPTLLDLSEYNGQYFSTGKSLFDNSVNRDCRFVYGEDNRIFVFYEKDYYILLRDSPYNLKDKKILSNKCLHSALAMEELLYSSVYTGVNLEN